MKKILTICLLVFLMPLKGYSATIQANSCSYTHVNAAVASADNGYKVMIPSGDCDWGSNTLTITKAIHLQGAGAGGVGSCSVGATCITTTGLYGIILDTGNVNTTFSARISGIRLVTSSASTTLAIQVRGKGHGWRIDNNIIEANNQVAYGVDVANYTDTWSNYGLIDSNIFYRTKVTSVGYFNAAEDSWSSPAQWGTDKAIFVENNIFYMNINEGTTSNTIDSNGGARMVLRYNTFYEARVEAHSAVMTDVRGARSYEIYNNEFKRTIDGWLPTFSLRAGSYVIARNHIAGLFQPAESVQIDNRRSYFDVYSTKNAQCLATGNPSACCTGAGTGTCGIGDASSNVGFGDCNGWSYLSLQYDTFNADPAHPGTAGELNLICMDQPGAGTGALGSQTLDPIYIWDNITSKICLGGSNKYGSCTSDSDCPDSTCSTKTLYPNRVHLNSNTNNMPYAVVAGRNFYDDTVAGYPRPKPGWTPYTCPHPLADPTAAGSCLEGIAGTDGYVTSGAVPLVVTPSVVGGGAISPATAETVESGDNSAEYSVTARSGWKYSAWGGTCGATGSGATYQKTNVTEDCTVTATFIPIQQVLWSR